MLSALMQLLFGPLAASLAFWFGLRDWSHQDTFLGPAATLRGCPLARLETTLAMTRGYERLYSRGFDTHDVWALVTALQFPVLPLRIPKEVGHFHVPYDATIGLRFPRGQARFVLHVRLLTKQHIFFSRQRPQWGWLDRLWLTEPRALRKTCARMKL